MALFAAFARTNSCATLAKAEFFGIVLAAAKKWCATSKKSDQPLLTLARQQPNSIHPPKRSPPTDELGYQLIDSGMRA